MDKPEVVGTFVSKLSFFSFSLSSVEAVKSEHISTIELFEHAVILSQ